MSKLQQAYANQITNKSIKEDWQIISWEEVLATFPKHLSEQEIMDVIKFWRKVETETFSKCDEVMKIERKRHEKETLAVREFYENEIIWLKKLIAWLKPE